MSGVGAESVVDADRVSAIHRVYGFAGLHVGRHILRDARGWKTGEQNVRHLWLAEIRPTFDVLGCLAMVATDQHQLAVFATGGEMAVGPLALPADWDDPVVAALRSFDLWSAEGGIALDGVNYGFYLDSGDLQVAMSLNNPRAPQPLLLERALLRVAETLSAWDASGAVEAFHRTWASYAASHVSESAVR